MGAGAERCKKCQGWARRDAGSIGDRRARCCCGAVIYKKLDRVVGAQKEYEAIVRLGQTSTTDDAEGERTVHSSVAVPTYDDVHHAVAQFVGEITQIPPVYSAIKIGGVAAYKRVRRGQHVTMSPRTVRIDAIDIVSYGYPDISIRVVCGPGTYIRALARDLGAALHTGAYMAALRRIRRALPHYRCAAAVKILWILHCEWGML